jgi:RNA polymerase sigma factor (TIGR02999 family)
MTMSPSTQETVTRLLRRASDGEVGAADELVPHVLRELRVIAEAQFRGERPNHTLQPTALVNEAYLRLVGSDDLNWSSRQHFYALASRIMRNILVDHARAKRAEKRGGGKQRITIQVGEVVQGDAQAATDQIDLIALDEAMTALGELDERKARLVELRFFAGLNEQQAADLLGIARSTAAEDWRLARAWLRKTMRERA